MENALLALYASSRGQNVIQMVLDEKSCKDIPMGIVFYMAVGQTISANHLKAVKVDGVLCANGELLHYGKTSHFWDIKMKDDKKQLVAKITVTNSIILKHHKTSRMQH